VFDGVNLLNLGKKAIEKKTREKKQRKKGKRKKGIGYNV